MITQSGTKPLINPPKREFHRSFGGVSLNAIPDFNLDAGLWMPDQEADNAPTECTGYMVTDIKADFDKQLYTPDWQYAKTIQLEGVSPNTGGADFHVAMQSAVVFGSVRMIDMPFSSVTKGELFTSNIDNWPFSLNYGANKNAEIGTYNALGNGDAFSSIISAAYTNKMGVGVGTPWYYKDWATAPGGVVSMPVGVNNTTGLPWHAWVIKGKKTINGKAYAIGKSWQGKGYGDGGYHYIDQDTINAIMAVWGTGAISFADSGNRFLNLCRIFFSQSPQLLPLLPQILAAEMQLPQAQVINTRQPK